MSEKAKAILKPGLINLVLLECLFLFVAVYIGVTLWGGIYTPAVASAVNFIGGLLFLLFWSYRTRS